MTIATLEQFRRIFSEIPFNRILDLQLDAIEEDHVTLSFEMKEELIGNYMHGILHGGVISSVLDMAGGTAAMVSVAQKHQGQDLAVIAAILGKASTINLNVDFLRPGKSSKFMTTAHVVQSGNKITFTRMEMRDQENVLIATGTAAYMIG